MVTLTIDGREVRAKEGSTILEAALEEDIYIPTLCSVEIFRDGDSRIVASCLYPVEEGLVVKTDTERVMNIRKMTVELLLARCPDVKVIQDLAHKFGVERTEFTLEDKKCILCGLCARVCEEIVGVGAISLVGRGTERSVNTPFLEEPGACIGCGSCAFVCPTSAIRMEDIGDTRTIYRWKRKAEFKLKECKKCGRYWATEAQIEHMKKKTGLPGEFFEVCPNCR